MEAFCPSLVLRQCLTTDNRTTNRDWKLQQLYSESSFWSRDQTHTALAVDNYVRMAVMRISSFPEC